ncbi:MAG: hypothetical protein KDD42_06710, partial [Bdellovibrionales bacterium]|nr:hypothetical protein [Bdellovibrionales bacterium]
NFYSYPEDYDATFLDKVWDVSQEEVREVAQKRWRISDFSIVVVGDRTAYNSLTAVLREYPDLLPGQEITMLKFNEVAEFFK